MNRLTQDGVDVCRDLCEDFDKCTSRKLETPIICLKAATYNNLRAYERTGLEPEEAEACKVALMGKTLAEIKEIEGLSIERMKELAKAEADDRLLILPCKVGDTVYKVWYDPCHKGETHPDSYGCSGCEDVCDIKKSIHELKAPSVDWIFRQLHNGSFVYFLTREEAEAARKEEPRDEQEP